MLTLTGAWSRFAAVPGWTSRTVSATVSWLGPEPPAVPWLADGWGWPPLPWPPLPWPPPPWPPPPPDVATDETAATTPGMVVTPSGIVTVTWSPACTRYSWLTGSWAVTTGTGDVAVSTAAPGCGGDPTLGVTPATRSGPGANAIWPSGTVPVTGSPAACCHRSTA